MGIGLIVVGYAVACAKGWPQRGTELVVAGHHHGDEDAGKKVKKPPTIIPPPIAMVLPFALLLGCIAVLPLIPQTEHWWESNLHRFYVAGILGLATLAYYVFWHSHTVEAHWPSHDYAVPVPGQLQWNLAWTVLANAILHEYIPFIVLLFSLYAISGGIRIEGNLAAHPLTNLSFITVGGLLASFIGTTGAAMLLIRPLLETNKERKHKVHTVVIFIFVVCNCGGCLLPIGDPPLFLGYLRGVDFLWTMNLWQPWLFVNSLLLVFYWLMDHFVYYPHETIRDITRDEVRTRRLQIRGWGLNGVLLLGVVVSVGILDPSKAVPGTHWHSPMYLREVVQLGLVAISLMFGSVQIRRENYFSYHAIVEVAALFFGIFLCMQPALQILGVRGPSMGVTTPMQFFWYTGTLSSVLDNAPTYVVFFETARTLNGPGVIIEGTIISEPLLIAISLGAVFMGAMTYIGNGPNFMVKAIAETSGIRMPSFFGFLKYSIGILLPILIITTWIFL